MRSFRCCRTSAPRSSSSSQKLVARVKMWRCWCATEPCLGLSKVSSPLSQTWQHPQSLTSFASTQERNLSSPLDLSPGSASTDSLNVARKRSSSCCPSRSRQGSCRLSSLNQRITCRLTRINCTRSQTSTSRQSYSAELRSTCRETCLSDLGMGNTQSGFESVYLIQIVKTITA